MELLIFPITDVFINTSCERVAPFSSEFFDAHQNHDRGMKGYSGCFAEVRIWDAQGAASE